MYRVYTSDLRYYSYVDSVSRPSYSHFHTLTNYNVELSDMYFQPQLVGNIAH